MVGRDILRVGVCHLAGASNPAADLHALTNRADLIALTGAAEHRAQIREFIGEHRRWEGYLGDRSPGAGDTPLLWDVAALRRRGARTTEAVPQRHVGAAGTGPAPVPRKVNNRVQFTHHGTGRRVQAVAVDLVAAADRLDLPLLEQDHRRQHYAAHVRALVTETRFRLGLMFLAGQFAAEPYFDLLDPLHRAGFDPHPGTGEGGRVWHRGDAAPLVVDLVPGSGPRPSMVVGYAV